MLERTKKPLFIFLTVLLAITALVGCNNEEKKQTSKTGAITFTVWSGNAGKEPPSDNKILKQLKKKTGVTLNYEYTAGDVNQKLGAMIASGDYPDMVLEGGTRLQEAGAAIALDDLINKNAPNLKKLVGPTWSKDKEVKDGKLYIIPTWGLSTAAGQDTSYSGGAFWIQKDVLADAGYPKDIKTLDQYFDLIKKYKEKYPKINGQPTVGFEILSAGSGAFCLYNPPEYLSGHPNDGGVVVDNNVATIFADKDISNKYYKKLNEMNQIGIVDKETFTQTKDQYLAKIASGRVLGMYDQHWQFQSAENSLIAENKLERTYAPLPIVYDKNTTDRYRERRVPNINHGISITTKCKDPKRAIKFLDYIATEEGGKLANWGIEGEDYLVNDKGMYYRTPEMRKNFDNPDWKLKNSGEPITSIFPHADSGLLSDGKNAVVPGDQLDEYYDGLKDYDKKFLSNYGFKIYTQFLTTPPKNEIYYPCWQINNGDGTPAAVANQKITDTQSKYLPRLILSEPNNYNKLWKEYTDELHKIDIKAYEKVINKGIQYRIKNWK